MKATNYKLRQNNLSKRSCYGDIKVREDQKLDGQTFFQGKSYEK